MKKSPRQTIASVRTQRRSFLKGMLAAGTFSLLSPRLLLAQGSGGSPRLAPSERVNLACVGIGNRGAEIIDALNRTGLANIVALCDVDMGGKQTLGILNKFPNAPRFQDFRKMFDKMSKEIDAVCIGTPDFSHFAIAMLAMSLGKHVYVEKPLAHTFRQVDLMMAAETKYKVAAQMGNQGHSDANFFQFQAWVNAGIIKNVTKITAFMNNPRRWHGKTFSDYLPAEPIPETMDWDGWLSTAKEHPFNQGYHNGEWRSWFDFGNGALGDWGAHIIDTAHEFLNLGLPTEVNPVLGEGHSKFIFPQASTLVFKFPARGAMPPVELTWYDGQNNLPPLPSDFGDAVVAGDIPPPSTGSIDTKKHPPGKVIYGEGLTFKGGSHGSTLKIIPESKAKDIESRLPEVPRSPSNHFANFLRACKGQEKCRSNFAISGPLCQAMTLGIIAQQVNTRLLFDRTTRRFTNSKFANDLLDGPPPRKGWEQFYKL
jgi:predicted dehydrogenase